MKKLSNVPKNVTFQMVFVKNESGRIRVHPQPLYMFCIIIKYNLRYNIMNEHECGNRLKINQNAKILKISVI